MEKFLTHFKNNKIKYLFLTAIAIIVFLLINPDLVSAVNDAETQKNFTNAFNKLSGIIKQISLFLIGFSVLSGIATLIYHFIKLGASGGNPQARAKAIQDMLVTGLCIALLGSVNIIIFFVLSW
jgi:hypothetical protein